MRIAILLTSIAAATMSTGCASILNRIDEDDIAKFDALAEQWIARIEEKHAETPAPETPPASAAVDQLDYALLQWKYGGIDASGATLDTPRLSSLAFDGRTVSYTWNVGMSVWGLSNGDAGAICAIFFDREGKWVGGKFDWISVSRTNRGLKHVTTYNNWPTSGIRLPWGGRVAFVVISADGKRRSNVLVAEGSGE